ncbi:MAG: hypothetical protein ABL870_00945, partial [Sediminibacterium sp.]
MQLLLDKEMPLDKPKKRFLWVLIPTLLVLGIGGSWWYNRVDQQLEVKETITKPILGQTPKPIDQQSNIEQNTTNPAETQTNVQSSLNQSKDISAIKSVQTTPSLLNQMGIAEGPIDQVMTKENSQSSFTNNNSNDFPPSNSGSAIMENNTVSDLNPVASSTQSQTTNSNTNLAKEKSSSIIIKNKNTSEKGFFIGLTAGIDAS